MPPNGNPRNKSGNAVQLIFRGFCRVGSPNPAFSDVTFKGGVSDPALQFVYPPMKPRILFAGFFHETHTFLEGTTAWSDFDVTRGDDILKKLDDGSPTDGFLQVAQDAGLQVIPTIDARCLPSAILEDEAFENFWSELAPQATTAIAGGIDAIYLLLHGGMCTQTIRDPEGELLSRIRALPGAAELPLFGVFDLHANLSLRTFRLSQGLVCYRHNPHSDARESAMRATQIMVDALTEKRIPRTLGCQLPLLLPPPSTGTADDPMKALEMRARELETVHDDILVINIVGGFAFADSHDTGVSLSVIYHDNDQLAKTVLTELAHLAWSMRGKAEINYPTADDLLARIKPDPKGPTLLVEPSDNIGGGAPGDCTGVLRALLKHGTKNALLAINDPEAVAALADAKPGEVRTLAIGGKRSRLDPGPVTLEVTFVSRSDGKFTLVDRHSHLASMGGVNIDMHACAVVHTANLTLLLTSRKTPPFDLGQYRSQGIEPKDFAFIGVKAAVGHRQGYDPITAQSYWVDTPGPCRSELTSFPWQQIRRPIHPLDPITNPEFNFS